MLLKYHVLGTIDERDPFYLPKAKIFNADTKKEITIIEDRKKVTKNWQKVDCLYFFNLLFIILC